LVPWEGTRQSTLTRKRSAFRHRFEGPVVHCDGDSATERQILFPERFVNHALPSGPVVMPWEAPWGVGSGKSVNVTSGVARTGSTEALSPDAPRSIREACNSSIRSGPGAANTARF